MDIPTELLYQIAVYLPHKYLDKLSLFDNRFKLFNQDETFWLNKVKLDYQYSYKPVNLNWYDFYLQLTKTQIRVVPLIHNTLQIGIVLLKIEECIDQVIDQVLAVYREPQPSIIINIDPIQYFIIRDGKSFHQQFITSFSRIAQDTTDSRIFQETKFIEILDDENNILNRLIKSNKNCVKCNSTNLIQWLSYKTYGRLYLLNTCHSCFINWIGYP